MRSPNAPTEVLIGKVARKEIEITIADSNVALLNRRYYPQSDNGVSPCTRAIAGLGCSQGAFGLAQREIDRFF